MSKKVKNKNKHKVTISTKKVLENLLPIVEDIAGDLGLTVLETSFNRERGHYFLRVFIYHDNRHITHDDCTTMTKRIGEVVDDTDLIEVPYSIEISSPGINRKLKNPIEFDIYKDRDVKIVLKKTDKTQKKGSVVNAVLAGLTEDHKQAIVLVNGEEKLYNLNEIKSIQLEG